MSSSFAAARIDNPRRRIARANDFAPRVMAYSGARLAARCQEPYCCTASNRPLRPAMLTPWGLLGTIGHMSNEAELMQQLVDLVDYDLCPRIELDGPGGVVGIWSDDDIIGTGASTSEAIADAILTVRGWQ